MLCQAEKVLNSINIQTKLNFIASDKRSSLLLAQCKKSFIALTTHVSLDLRLGPNVIKLFTSIIYECCNKIRVFVPDRSFLHGLMSVSKAWSLPQSGVPERCFIRVGSGLTRQDQTRPESPVGAKALTHEHYRKLRPKKIYNSQNINGNFISP